MRNILFCFLLITATSCVTAPKTKSKTEEGCEKYFHWGLKMYVYEKVEIMPTFPNGQIAFLKIFLQNYQYPESEQEHFQGKIILEFIVDKNGKIVDKRIYKKKFEDYTIVDQEALITLDKLPKWIPGKCNDKSVATKMYFPINF